MKIPALIFLLIPLTLQAQLKESFEEGRLDRWQQYPPLHWETSSINALQGQNSLHHSFDSCVPGYDRISLLHDPLWLDSLNTTWKFCLLHTSHPSSANNWAVFLTANQPASFMDPDSNLCAYALGVNLDNNDDCLNLYKINNRKLTRVIHSGYNWQSGTSLHHKTCLQIERNTGGEWSLALDTTGFCKDFFKQGSGSDTACKASNYIGLSYHYTSTNDQKLWFDELEVNGFFTEDINSPVIREISVVSSCRLRIQFSEAVNTGKLPPDAFSVNNGTGSPVSREIQSPSALILTFTGPFTPACEYEIAVSAVEDIYGNAAGNLKGSFIYYSAKPFDIVIHEIMADPEPAMGLPDVEYIELMNNTDFEIDAQGWSLLVGETSVDLPSFRMVKQGYLLLCEAHDSMLLRQYGTVLPLEGMPALNNEGAILSLKNADGTIIHSVAYSVRWFSNPQKAEGGWSLEMIDPGNPCGRQNNWAGSDHFPGGTPGFSNSVSGNNPDNTSPYLYRAATTGDSAILVSFNEPMIYDGLSDPFTYSVNPAIYHPFSAVPLPPDYASVTLAFQTRFEPGRLYELMVKDVISDCSGNLLANSYIDFGLASCPDSFDLVINEVLFDARDDEEFIEIFNRSGKVIELSSLRIVLMDEFTGGVIKILCEISGHIQLLPGHYLVITNDAFMLQQHYHCSDPAALYEAPGMASLPDKAGTIALMDETCGIIDRFIYSSDYHIELIADPEGISLERLHCDHPTNDPENWHSAAEDAGFATPGSLNSQSFSPPAASMTSVWTVPDVFTPDNDGHDDYLALLYHFDKTGLIANVMVFDPNGNLVKQLANNVLLGTEGFFTWDGTNRKGFLEKAGLYIVYTEVFSDKGIISKYKNTCVLAKKVK